MIRVPVGTQVRRRQVDGSVGFMRDLAKPGESIVVVRGGKGGWGNARFASSTNQAPRIAQRGQRGEEATLILELKLLCDVGIIGMPNAGKSTLLTLISAAHPKIADYAFTTLEPVLGVVEMGYRRFVVAEIPGLIEGAHLGSGLGHDFLRHAERARVFIHLLDGSRSDPLRDMEVINGELGQFGEQLARRQQVVAVNKIDIAEVRCRQEDLGDRLRATEVEPLFISAAGGEGVGALLERVAEALSQAVEEAPAPSALPVITPRPLSGRFQVTVADRVYKVSGQRVETFAEMMPLEQEEGRAELWRRLGRWGVVAALRRAGIQAGDKVRLGQVELEWEG